MSGSVFPQLVDAAAARYRPAGRFAVGWARGKLGGDPAFRELLQAGLLGQPRTILDIGCGQGVLAALLVEAASVHRTGRWPANWPAPPQAARVHGIELMADDVARASAALGDSATFVVGDMCDTGFPRCETVVILDVLHYVPFDAQDRVLARVRDALAPHGRLLLRIGDAAGGFGFRFSQWVDRTVMRARGHRISRLYCRPVDEWVAALRALDFVVETRPMSAGTLFANVLLIADL